MKRINKSKPLVIIQCYEDRQPTLPLKKVDHTPLETTKTNDYQMPKREATDNPPPPPPMPISNGHQNGHLANTENLLKAVLDLKAPNCRKNGTLNRTPTPDYNEKTTLLLKKDDKAELDSLESYKLKNPVNVAPKPPSNYFIKAPNGTTTMKKHARPVSVTICEYTQNGNGRREPTKLDFLSADVPDGVINDGHDVPITNRLQSELALTLSRSNLRKKTEALVKNIKGNINLNDNDNDSDASLDKNFHARYGNNLLPLPPSITIPKVVTKVEN